MKHPQNSPQSSVAPQSTTPQISATPQSSGAPQSTTPQSSVAQSSAKPQSLSLLEIRILTAVCRSRMSVYKMGRWAEDDTLHHLPMSNGSLYKAAGRLESRQLIAKLEDENKIRYEITEAGVVALEKHLAIMGMLITIGRQRIRKHGFKNLPF